MMFEVHCVMCDARCAMCLLLAMMLLLMLMPMKFFLIEHHKDPRSAAVTEMHVQASSLPKEWRRNFCIINGLHDC